LWWTAGLPGISTRARAAIEEGDRIGISTISCWELAMLVARRRVELDAEVDTWVSRALAQDRIEPLPLYPEVAVAAGLLTGRLHGDPADRIIYATAQANGAVLVTKDRGLREFDPQRTLW
jgi:PIN domain nuclease of toxin-antitoxin system